jgi:hypothetical protein
MKLAVLLVACALAIPVAAVEKTFSWTAPTAYTDGTPLPAAQIAGYTLNCSPTRTLAIAGAVTTFKADFGPGSHTCALVTRAANGQVSAPSNSVNFTVPQPVPNAATGLSVE